VRRASTDPNIDLGREPRFRAALQAEIEARRLDITLP